MFTSESTQLQASMVLFLRQALPRSQQTRSKEVTCAVTGLRPVVEQLREALHLQSPSRCWGSLLPAVLRSLPRVRRPRLPAANLPHFPLMKCPWNLVFVWLAELIRGACL